MHQLTSRICFLFHFVTIIPITLLLIHLIFTLVHHFLSLHSHHPSPFTLLLKDENSKSVPLVFS